MGIHPAIHHPIIPLVSCVIALTFFLSVNNVTAHHPAAFGE